jgi:hypothetical protein
MSSIDISLPASTSQVGDIVSFLKSGDFEFIFRSILSDSPICSLSASSINA